MEAARILKPNGLFVFTDLMQTDGVDVNDMKEIYARIKLDNMGSPGQYKFMCRKHGMRFID